MTELQTSGLMTSISLSHLMMGRKNAFASLNSKKAVLPN